MLEKDPYRRISADQALKHIWFQNNKGKVAAKNSDFIKSLSNYYVLKRLLSGRITSSRYWKAIWFFRR